MTRAGARCAGAGSRRRASNGSPPGRSAAGRRRTDRGTGLGRPRRSLLPCAGLGRRSRDRGRARLPPAEVQASRLVVVSDTLLVASVSERVSPRSSNGWDATAAFTIRLGYIVPPAGSRDPAPELLPTRYRAIVGEETGRKDLECCVLLVLAFPAKDESGDSGAELTGQHFEYTGANPVSIYRRSPSSQFVHSTNPPGRFRRTWECPQLLPDLGMR